VRDARWEGEKRKEFQRSCFCFIPVPDEIVMTLNPCPLQHYYLLQGKLRICRRSRPALFLMAHKEQLRAKSHTGTEKDKKAVQILYVISVTFDIFYKKRKTF
jgi:hypothetical protein